MEDFPGYTIIERIGETLNSRVFRAHKEGGPDTVIIKVLKVEHPTPEEIARFKHEAELIRGISLDGVVRILDVIDSGSTVAMILEDFGGVTLKDLIADGFPMERFLELAIRLAEILGNLHQHNISHRDIKPLNIIMNWKKDIIKITDFGIASEITRAKEEIYNPEVIEGSLVYMSPEQTGRMNCAVDYRTDLYSLGITFYEMLTGQLPFSAQDSIEIIHAHIAKMPARPEKINPDIPIPVADIIMKLMSKAAADRYQNCFGLAADLQKCLNQLRATGSITPFELGRDDISLKFIIPQILVGREKELEVLDAAFERVSHGGVEIFLVTGEPGIGKSALVNEIHKPIVGKRGYFIAGKYDQFRRYVPYSSIIQAFQGLARQLLSESEERIQEWKGRLLLALGPNGRIITDVIPEIELIIGKQPDIPELGPEQTQNRFNLFFKNFVRTFTDQTHPLVLFLDDLQWADNASLGLIQTITMDHDMRFLLFIGAYRDNEVAAYHPLMLALETMRKTGLNINTITLGALNPDDVNKFIAYFLRCETDVSRPLARIIHDKTKGNPFFINQFLKNLYEGRHIVLEPGRGWAWKMSKIMELQVTDNVVNFMADRLRDLPTNPLKLLQLCACIGNRFDALTLATITSQSIDEILSTLDTLIQDGLINRTGDLYRFHHDRIHEAAYSLLSPAEREQTHYRIGTLDLKQTPSEQLYNRIFYIVDQLNQGRRLLSSPAEKRNLADLNLKAGVKAKESTAYGAAVSYLSVGIELLGQDTWQTDYRLTYDLYKELMECAYLNRDFDQAERLFEIIIAHAASKIDTAKAYNTMVVLYTNLRSPKEAIELGLKALKLFGINFSINASKRQVVIPLFKALRNIKRLSLEKILDLPLAQDEEILAVHELMINIATPAFYVNPNLLAAITLRAVNDTFQYGHQPHSAVIFAGLATIVQTALGDYELGYRIGEMALKLNERLGNLKVAGPIHHVFAFFIQHWKKHISFDLAVYPKVYEYSMNAGNFIYAGHSITAGAETRLRISQHVDDVLDDVKKYEGFMNTLHDPLITKQYYQLIRHIMAMKGLTEDRYDLSGDGFDLSATIERHKKEGNLFGLCFALFPRVLLHSRHGKYEEALAASIELDKYIYALTGTLLVADHYFHYSTTMTALLKQGEKVRKGKFEALIRRNQRKMKKWAQLCPENFKHKYDLVQAEFEDIKGHPHEALGLYHAAIDGAQRNQFRQDEAMACERLALHYLARGFRGEAGFYMQRSYEIFRSWGATAKEKDLLEKYTDLLHHARTIQPVESAGNTSTMETTSRLLDLDTVMQVSQVISSEIMLDRLLQKTMHMSLTNAGAQRGYLMLESDGKLTVEASEDADSGENRVLQSIPLEECQNLSQAIVNYVLRSGKNLILGNAMRDGPYTNDPHVVRDRCKSILCTPILNKGKLTGILYMENNLTADAFTPKRLEILRIIASQAAISLENAKLFDLATTDGLTKLFVHRYFHLMLDQEIQRSRRYHRPFALAMIDIDKFKRFNDTYGHQLGDEVLRNVARTIRKNIRPIDIAARYGGEEFVIIFPETNAEKALVATEKIRTAIEQIEIPYESEKLHVTVSIGLSAFPRHGQDKESIIKCADEALYTAKRIGKNQVCVGGKIQDL